MLRCPDFGPIFMDFIFVYPTLLVYHKEALVLGLMLMKGAQLLNLMFLQYTTLKSRLKRSAKGELFWSLSLKES